MMMGSTLTQPQTFSLRTAGYAPAFLPSCLPASCMYMRHVFELLIVHHDIYNMTPRYDNDTVLLHGACYVMLCYMLCYATVGVCR